LNQYREEKSKARVGEASGDSKHLLARKEYKTGHICGESPERDLPGKERLRKGRNLEKGIAAHITRSYFCRFVLRRKNVKTEGTQTRIDKG